MVHSRSTSFLELSGGEIFSITPHVVESVQRPTSRRLTGRTHTLLTCANVPFKQTRSTATRPVLSLISIARPRFPLRSGAVVRPESSQMLPGLSIKTTERRAVAARKESLMVFVHTAVARTQTQSCTCTRTRTRNRTPTRSTGFCATCTTCNSAGIDVSVAEEGLDERYADPTVTTSLP